MHLAFNPTPVVEVPPQDESVADPNPTLGESVTETEPDTSVPGGVATNSGSFRFIQASELETPAFEEEAEWVEKSDAAEHVEPQVNGHHVEEGASPAPTPADV